MSRLIIRWESDDKEQYGQEEFIIPGLEAHPVFWHLAGLIARLLEMGKSGGQQAAHLLEEGKVTGDGSKLSESTGR